MFNNVSVLPVDNTPDSGFLVSQDDTPVWPVKNAGELYALQQIVSVFGSRLELTKGSRGNLPFTGDEEVVALGESVIENAQLYAHLTQRRFRAALSLNDLTSFDPPAVVITTTDWLNLNLLEFLYPGKSNMPATGIIFADTPEQLHLQVLIRSAAALLNGSLEICRIDIFPLIPMSQQVNSDDWLILGRDAPPDMIRNALTRGAGILTLETHAGGVDADLGPNLVLCSMDRSPLTADRKQSPRCQVTGICHPRETSIEVALNSNALLFPESIRARVLFIDGCGILLLKDSIIDPAWGLIPRLLASPTIGAILTSWEVVLTSPQRIDRLVTDISQGLTVGQALTQFHYSDAARNLDRRICILGDPTVRLPQKEPDRVNLYRVEDRSVLQKTSSYDADELKGLTFLRAYLMEQIHSLKDELLEIARALLTLIETYELLTWRGSPVEDYWSAPGHLIRRLLVKFLLKRGSYPSRDWLRLSGSVKVASPNKLCFSCGMRVKIVVVHLRVIGASPRRLTTCVRCGILEDCPVDFPSYGISFQKAGVVRLIGKSFPQDRWAAGLLLDSSLPSTFKGWEWPADKTGSPVEVFRTPDAWPIGPLRVAVFLIWKGNMAVISMGVGSLENL